VYELGARPSCVVGREAELLGEIRGDNLGSKASSNAPITTKEQNSLRPDFFQAF
jgi:hypothetical protein